MKKIIKKKLELNKNTISSLNNKQLSQINGGTDLFLEDEERVTVQGQTCPDGACQPTEAKRCTSGCGTSR